MSIHRRNIRGLCLAGTALAGALSLMTAPAYAQEQRFELDVPSQRLDTALRAFAQQTHQQLMFAVGDTKGFNAPALNGSYSADEAIAMLVAGTGLQVHRNTSGVFLIEAAADPQSGSAAGDGADQGTVQALIVTAQKREEDIQDVPIAISAFTQESLERSQIAGGPDLMTQVPNMTFTKTNFSSYSIQIRGIGTQAISATTDPAVAVAFNNTPFVRNRFFEQEFYDLQRVEVLRGPQGTLYGRNATAGVVNIISAKPTFGYEAKLSGDVSNYSSTRLEGMVNMPLVDDVVALRLAGAWTKRDGYVTNQITGNPIDGRDLWSTRLSLRFSPNDRIDANLIWEHFQEDDDRLRSGKQLCHKDLKTEIGGVPVPTHGGGAFGAASYVSQGCVAASLYSPDSFQTPNGFALPYYGPTANLGNPVRDSEDPYLSATQSRDLRVIESTRDPEYRAKSDLGELQVSIDIADGLTLSSETAYSADSLFSTQDFNRFNTKPGAFKTATECGNFCVGGDVPGGGIVDDAGVFCDPQLGCSDRLVLADLSTAKSRQFSQEFRLGSDFDGPFNFSLGANFLRYDTEDKYYVFVNSLTMFASQQWGSRTTPYVGGVSDNSECLDNFLPGNPNVINGVINCIYIDPNPIGNLNDQGHNYFLSKNPYRLISYAIFGEAYYQITPALKVTGGLRWTVDKKRAPLIPSWLLASGHAGYPVSEVVVQEWREPTGRLAIDWKPDFTFTDETLLYASYAHGYKAGGANPPPPVIATYGPIVNGDVETQQRVTHELLTHPKTFDPEFVDAFEIGSKNTLLGGKLTLNGDVFYYNYKDYQISEIVDRSALNLNFDAHIWGAELEAEWRPVDNLKLGFKGGYENTRVADGEKAIDLMDRTAGNPYYMVYKPFPTMSSNCILPVWWVTYTGELWWSLSNPCVEAYLLNHDPATQQAYTPNPQGLDPTFWGNNYPGFNPASVPNNGEGIEKDLSGNQLPNAPHFTATVTADYTIPLRSDWLMTLHTDLYYQSEAWTRIFNMEGYDKLKAYTNVNLAAIFTNQDAGWKVMAYVKNVFDKDSITGAFLNSDDTGLTTNVFLTEPRLYGIRVTKEWTGGPWWTGANPDHAAGEPYPLTVELGGGASRFDAPNQAFSPAFTAPFPEALDPRKPQGEDLDWGDSREVKLTYRAPSSPWNVSAAAQFGKTNGTAGEINLGTAVRFYPGLPPAFPQTRYDYVISDAQDREDHTLVDFSVGRDLGVGWLGAGSESSVKLALRYGQFNSESHLRILGTPDYVFAPTNFFKYPRHFHKNAATLEADRSFEGAGPIVSWDASKRLTPVGEQGGFNLDWTLGGGVLFGKQKLDEAWDITGSYYKGTIKYQTTTPNTPIATDIHRAKSVTVPYAGAALGLSYSVQRIKVSAGYRYDRYFDLIDGGLDEHKSYDRTIDGPYFKLAVGFGG